MSLNSINHLPCICLFIWFIFMVNLLLELFLLLGLNLILFLTTMSLTPMTLWFSVTSGGSSNMLVDFPLMICPCPQVKLCTIKKGQKNPINRGRWYYVSTCNVSISNLSPIICTCRHMLEYSILPYNNVLFFFSFPDK